MHLVFRPRLFGGLIAIAALRLHFEISRRRDLAVLKGSAVFYVVQAVIPSLAYHKLRCSELCTTFSPKRPPFISLNGASRFVSLAQTPDPIEGKERVMTGLGIIAVVVLLVVVLLVLIWLSRMD